MAKNLPQTTIEEIKAGIGTALDSFELFHNQILVGIYMRPERTASGIYLTDNQLDEDRWQGKVGVVLKKGPGAFVDDDVVSFHGINVEEGDWIYYRVSDGTSLDIRGIHCRMLEDVHIKGRVGSPSDIY